jgi:hypothetical protein
MAPCGNRANTLTSTKLNDKTRCCLKIGAGIFVDFWLFSFLGQRDRYDKAIEMLASCKQRTLHEA